MNKRCPDSVCTKLATKPCFTCCGWRCPDHLQPEKCQLCKGVVGKVCDDCITSHEDPLRWRCILCDMFVCLNCQKDKRIYKCKTCHSIICTNHESCEIRCIYCN